MNEDLKQKTKKGIIWSAIERFSTQGLQFLITLVMARMLTPENYGVIGMLGVFIAISSVFVDSGFTSALMRKQDRTQEDLSTVFFFNIGIGILAYLVMFAIAPWVASFYDMPVLKDVLRVFALVIIINSLKAVQATLFIINLDFKTSTRITIIAISISGVVGILFAYLGFTHWAIVIQALTSALIGVLLSWYYSRWRPSRVFSVKSFKEMFAFGSNLLMQGLIDNLYKNIYPIVIGKAFSAGTLGNYTRGESFANFPSIAMTGVLQKVTYPVLCKMQDDESELARAYRKFLKLSAFVIFPLMMGVAALSHEFVILVIGEKWRVAADLLQILCFALMWYPIHAINLNLLQVKGRTDLSLRLEIIKKVMGVAIICISLPLGIVAMCYFRIASSLISLAINTYYTSKLINLGFFKQMHDLLPTIVISVTMFAVIVAINSLLSSLWLQLVAGIVVGIAYYTVMSYLFNKSEWATAMSLLKRK